MLLMFFDGTGAWAVKQEVVDDMKHCVLRIAQPLASGTFATLQQRQQRKQTADTALDRITTTQTQHNRSKEAAASASSGGDVDGETYYLPDGSAVAFTAEERDSASSLFFGGAHTLVAAAKPPPAGSSTVQELVTECVARCDVDIRHTLYQSVIVTGSGSLLPGFAERLASEMHAATPLFRGKVVAAPASDERRFGAWIGGSILGSLGTFHQLWISRAEYDECGKAIVEKKCP